MEVFTAESALGVGDITGRVLLWRYAGVSKWRHRGPEICRRDADVAIRGHGLWRLDADLVT